ncbi:hypothetical protein PVAP13_9KG152885 [Panicum virgatum]|uniref:Uncharacterized protein n=1 Tax=Panicum virgatum TaxID=38727 RepID=A0A8T0NFM6_PANVG|nr:hypothetical protein PVAP13_9KG152885 [Panicum virgatum]
MFQCKKMMDMEGFLGQLIDKHREQLRRGARTASARPPSSCTTPWPAAARGASRGSPSRRSPASAGWWRTSSTALGVPSTSSRGRGRRPRMRRRRRLHLAAAAGGLPPAGALRRPPAGRDDDAGGAAAPAGGLADGRGPGRRRPRRAGLQRLRRWARELRWIRRRRNLQRRRRRHLQRCPVCPASHRRRSSACCLPAAATCLLLPYIHIYRIMSCRVYYVSVPS